MNQLRQEEMDQKREVEEEEYNKWLQIKRENERKDREEYEIMQLKKAEEQRILDERAIFKKVSDEIALSIVKWVKVKRQVKFQDIMVKFRLRYRDIIACFEKYHEVPNGHLVLDRECGLLVFVSKEEASELVNRILVEGRISYSDLVAC